MKFYINIPILLRKGWRLAVYQFPFLGTLNPVDKKKKAFFLLSFSFCAFFCLVFLLPIGHRACWEDKEVSLFFFTPLKFFFFNPTFFFLSFSLSFLSFPHQKQRKTKGGGVG